MQDAFFAQNFAPWWLFHTYGKEQSRFRLQTHLRT